MLFVVLCFFCCAMLFVVSMVHRRCTSPTRKTEGARTRTTSPVPVPCSNRNRPKWIWSGPKSTRQRRCTRIEWWYVVAGIAVSPPPSHTGKCRTVYPRCVGKWHPTFFLHLSTATFCDVRTSPPTRGNPIGRTTVA